MDELILRIIEKCERWLYKKGAGEEDLFGEDAKNASEDRNY